MNGQNVSIGKTTNPQFWIVGETRELVYCLAYYEEHKPTGIRVYFYDEERTVDLDVTLATAKLNDML